MNKTVKFVLALAVLVLVIFGIIRASQNDARDGGFNVGLISILSGEYAVVGENFSKGIILASEEYNALHPEAKVSLFVEDDGFNGGRGMSAYQKLVSANKIDALINASTPTIDSIYDMVVSSGMPVIQGGEQGREPADDNVFGIFPNSIDSEYDYGVYMRNKGVKEMTLVYTNNDAMIRFVEAFKRGFQGSTTVFIINADEKDFRPHALKASESKPTTVGLFIFPQQGAQFMKEYLKIAKTKPQFFFDASFQSGYADYKRILGDLSVLDGSIVGTINFPTTEDFKKAYMERFGVEPGFLADIGYDAFNVLVSAHDKDQERWIANVQKTRHTGASGKTEFGPTGNRKPDTKMMVVREGVLVEIE